MEPHLYGGDARERCKDTCKCLMKFVPKAERPKWRETAIDAAEGVALHSLIALLIETKELERRQDDRETTKGGPTPWTRFASPPA